MSCPAVAEPRHLTTYAYDARNQRTAEYQQLAQAAQPMPTRGYVPGYTAPNADFTAGTLRTQWTYDGNGNVEDETDPKGQLRHHAYGVLNRLESVTYSGHVAPRVLPSIDSEAYTYTGTGQLDTVTQVKTTAAGAVTEVTQHHYDSLERREWTDRYDGYRLTFGYDTKGNRTRVEDASGDVSVYTYDAADRLKTATTSAGMVTYTYYLDGLLHTAVHQDTGAVDRFTETRDYDEAGRLRLLNTTLIGSGTPLVRFDYAYDDNGNRETQDETRGTGSVERTTYGYDDANRLVGVAYPNETQLYQLDAVGNRTAEKRASPGVVTALTVAAFAALLPAQASAYEVRQHNAVDWLLTKQVVVPSGGATTTLKYDGNGNRVEEGTRRYAWDIRDTLTQVTDGASVLGVYDYDASLQRVKADTASGHVEYVLDGKYVLRESGARTRRYHYGEGKGLSVDDGGGARWLSLDGLGSTSAEVTPGGSVTANRKHDAWGNYRDGTAPASGEVRLGYTGHQYDVETGLTYARARYYDSVNGVFLSRDSYEGQLNDAPSLHRYAYAHGNPLRYFDANGRLATLATAAIGAVLGAAVGAGIALYNHENATDVLNNAVAGAAIGGLAGLTLGASIAAAGAAGLGTADAIVARTTAWAGKGTTGVVADVGAQLLEFHAGVRKDWSPERSMAAFSFGTVGAPGVSTAVPALRPTLQATLGGMGLWSGTQMTMEGVDSGNLREVGLGLLYQFLTPLLA